MRVVFDGSTPRVNLEKRTIYLPILPDALDERTLALLRGWIDHESAHIRYKTRHAKAKHDGLLHLVHNVLEDVRVEKMMSEEFPGSNWNLEHGRALIMDDLTAPSNPIAAAALTILQELQTGSFDFMAELDDDARAVCERLIEAARPHAERGAEARTSAKTEKHAVRIVEEWRAILDEKDDPDEGGPEKTDDSETSDEEKDTSESEGSEESEDGDATSETHDEEVETDGGSESDDEDGSEESGDEGGSDEDGDSESDEGCEESDGSDSDDLDDTDATGADTSDDAMGGDAEDSDDAHGEDVGDGLKAGYDEDEAVDEMETREREAKDKLDSALETAVSEARASDDTFIDREYIVHKNSIQIDHLPQHTVDSYHTRAPDRAKNLDGSVRDQVSGLRQKLLADLRSRTQRRVRGQRKGKIDGGRLQRVAVGNPRVFRRTQEREGVDVAISILIDYSGSMLRKKKLQRAMELAHALTTTLSALKVEHEIAAFTAHSRVLGGPEKTSLSKKYPRHVTLQHILVKEFNERADTLKRLAYLSTGNGADQNVDGESVEIAAKRLLKRRESRRVLLVLSDGEPAGALGWADEGIVGTCDTYGARHLRGTVRRYEREGLEIVGIGICTDAPKKYYTQHVTYRRPEQLMTDFYPTLQSILRKGTDR
jgi:cobalamin biosynthesis protein CobT